MPLELIRRSLEDLRIPSNPLTSRILTLGTGVLFQVHPTSIDEITKARTDSWWTLAKASTG